MSTAEDPISSYEGPTAAHRFRFSLKKKRKKGREHEQYTAAYEITGIQEVARAYEIYEKLTRDTPSSLNHAKTYYFKS